MPPSASLDVVFSCAPARLAKLVAADDGAVSVLLLAAAPVRTRGAVLSDAQLGTRLLSAAAKRLRAVPHFVAGWCIAGAALCAALRRCSPRMHAHATVWRCHNRLALRQARTRTVQAALRSFTLCVAAHRRTAYVVLLERARDGRENALRIGRLFLEVDDAWRWADVARLPLPPAAGADPLCAECHILDGPVVLTRLLVRARSLRRSTCISRMLTSVLHSLTALCSPPRPLRHRLATRTSWRVSPAVRPPPGGARELFTSRRQQCCSPPGASPPAPAQLRC